MRANAPTCIAKHPARRVDKRRGAPIWRRQATDAHASNADWFELPLETEMLNITRFNPLDDPFENLFRGFLVRPLSTETGTRAPAPTQFCMDVTENEQEYRVLAEMPGVRKEDINVTINGNEVAVAAEVTHEKDVKDGETVLRAERYHGKIQRAFTLGQEVDEATAQAKYNDGILELTLPKKVVAAAKKLAVH
jgi:HSP20 family protein